MRFAEVTSRMTGFSCPVFGISWSPPTPDVTVARRIITFLEDRRVLYVPYEVETPQYCLDSVIAIRNFLTRVLGDAGIGQDLTDSARAMRAACRKFMTELRLGEDGRSLRKGAGLSRPWDVLDMHDVQLNQALGELRGVFGIHIGMIATKYGLDVEDGLASVLPVEQ